MSQKHVTVDGENGRTIEVCHTLNGKVRIEVFDNKKSGKERIACVYLPPLAAAKFNTGVGVAIINAEKALAHIEETGEEPKRP